MTKPKAMILAGDGLNCEKETARAFLDGGAEAEIVLINKFCKNPKMVHDYQIFAIPGGFSFGDELGAGSILAEKLKGEASEELESFKKNGHPMLGICNGLQIFLKLGLLPGRSKKMALSLAPNSHNRGFLDRWVSLETNPKSPSPWATQLIAGGQENVLPIRHGDGRLFLAEGEILAEHLASEQIVFRYSEDINGSIDNIAAITDTTGLVLGMMPHPEAFTRSYHCPWERDGTPTGLSLFLSIAEYLK